MSKNVIINGREFETYDNFEGEPVVINAVGHTAVLLSELERLGVTWEEVKPKFEDLPPGYYASTEHAWGDSVVYSKTPNGLWFATAIYNEGHAEQLAQRLFTGGKLKPLAWAETEED